jgi:hypothetical protein
MPAVAVDLYTKWDALTYRKWDANAVAESTTSVWNALQLMQKAAIGASALGLHDALNTQSDVFFLVANGFSGVYTALHASDDAYLEQGVQAVPFMAAWAISLTVVSIVVTLMVTWLIVKPTVWRVEDERQEILFLFLDLPKALLLSFAAKSEARLAALRLLAAGSQVDVADMDGVEEQAASEDPPPATEASTADTEAEHRDRAFPLVFPSTFFSPFPTRA